MKQAGPIPKALKLAPTLAQRIRQMRELRNTTVRDLAKRTRFGIKRIEDIESGLETWFSSADRQVLAKALTIEPALIEEVEMRVDSHGEEIYSGVSEAGRLALNEAIVSGAQELSCPQCGNDLKCTIQHGFDLDEQPIKLARAYCIKCPFVLR